MTAYSDMIPWRRLAKRKKKQKKKAFDEHMTYDACKRELEGEKKISTLFQR